MRAHTRTVVPMTCDMCSNPRTHRGAGGEGRLGGAITRRPVATRLGQRPATSMALCTLLYTTPARAPVWLLVLRYLGAHRRMYDDMVTSMSYYTTPARAPTYI